MHNDLKINTLGGGTHRPSEATIFFRVSRFIERKLRLPSHAPLPAPVRQRIVWCLHYHFEQRPVVICHRLNISQRTLYRDLSIMRTLIKHSRAEQQAVEELRDYILYMAKYLP